MTRQTMCPRQAARASRTRRLSCTLLPPPVYAVCAADKERLRYDKARRVYDSSGGPRRPRLFLFRARPPGLNQLLLLARRHRIVVAELHGIGALPTGERLEPRLVLGDLRERYERVERRTLPGERVVTVDACALGGEITGDVADGARGRRDLDAHDGLQHDRRGLGQRIEKRLASGGDKGDLLGVDRVLLAVIDRDAHILDGE